MRNERISIGGLTFLKVFGFLAVYSIIIRPLFKFSKLFFSGSIKQYPFDDLITYSIIGLLIIALFLFLDRYWQVYVDSKHVTAKKLFRTKSILKSNVLSLEVIDEITKRKRTRSFLVILSYITKNGKTKSLKFLVPANFKTAKEVQHLIRQKILA